MQDFNRQTREDIEQIVQQDIAELEKLVRLFDLMTRRSIAVAESEIEAARALADQNQVVKLQVKSSMLESSRDLFEVCYWYATGSRRRLWK